LRAKQDDLGNINNRCLTQKSQRRLVLQPVDFTTLTGACNEIRERWLPARIEQVYQRDRYTIVLGYARSISGVARYFLASPSCSSLYRRSTTPGTRYVYLQPTTAAPVSGLALVACDPIAPGSALWICSLPVVQGSRPLAFVRRNHANTATSSSPTKAK